MKTTSLLLHFVISLHLGLFAVAQPQNEVTDYTALLSGDYWTGFDTGPIPLVLGQPVFVTYSFAQVAPSSHANAMGNAFSSFISMDAAQRQQVRDALAIWDDACGITFLETPAGQGQMNFATYDFTASTHDGAGGIAFYPFGDWNFFSAPHYFDQVLFDASGDVFINQDFLVNGLPNFGTLVHEIGHAIGLKHPREVVFGHDEVLRIDLDTTDNTIMSVNGISMTIRPFDVAAVQAIYGSDADDGTQAASWNWNPATYTLTQNGFSTADVIIGVGSIDVINARNGDDRVFGLGSNDQLFGLGGDDDLWGGAGNDLLRGGTGADRLFGGSGSDTADYWTSATRVVVSLDETLAATGEARGDVFDSVENLRGSDIAADWLRGDNTANTLTGGGGNDTMEGRGGSDRMSGGLGADVLTGGPGADRFQYYSPSEAGDMITDFASVDFIYVKGVAFGGLPIGTLAANRFVQGTTPTRSSAQFLYDQVSGTLRFDSDGTGPSAATDLLSVDPGTSVMLSNLIVF